MAEEKTVVETRGYKAWCRLNDQGLPIAASVRRDPALIEGGEPIECRIVIKQSRPARDSDYAWVPVISEVEPTIK